MKKREFTFLLAVLFLFLSIPLFAEKRVIDNAGLLSSYEISEFQTLTEYIASFYKFDLVILTETNIGGANPMDYADDYFDYNGFKDHDGCLFLQVTGTRDYWFSTSGRGINILNSTAFDKLQTDVVKRLRNNDPAGAYRAFINDWETFLVLDAKGKSYNFITENAAIMYVVSWIVSLLIGLGVVRGMKANMKNVRPKTEADRFIIPGSLAFTGRQDTFLYSMVTKSEKADSPSSSSSGSHTGSSGSSHGGGGGKY